MGNLSESSFTCSDCGESVLEQVFFCSHCGSIFSNTVCCSIHSTSPADGGCVICSKPFCKECGGKVNHIYLCTTHEVYETYEGMARVAGCTDNVQAQFLTKCLEQAGFHPFLYSRYFNPGADIVAIEKIYRVYGEHPIVELKILVPFQEVLGAEVVLDEILETQ